MSRPPIKAMESIKNYCEKTQCRKCVFGYVRESILHFGKREVLNNHVKCRLMETIPCDWDTEPLGEDEK